MVVLLLLNAVLLVGCGSSSVEKSPTGTVTVKVTYGGKPIANASVNMVVPAESKSAFAQLDDQGTTTIENVQTGSYTVSVLPPAPEAPDPDKPTPPQKFENIPQKFRNETTSTLKATVEEGENNFEFDLKQ